MFRFDHCGGGPKQVLRVCRVNVEKQGKGLEAAARAARYQAFSDGLRKIIVLAHHRNDQIETFMLSAVRGGGSKPFPCFSTLTRHTRKTTFKPRQ
jgi:tRNA(Ile)-lysidine synthase